jgi:hypothetical protein
MEKYIIEHGKEIVALTFNPGGWRTATNFFKEKVGDGKMVM